MCGISGIINKNISKVDRKEIQKINDLIAHRGPDSEGFYFEKNFEIDFYVPEEKLAIQVSLQVLDQIDTREREIGAFVKLKNFIGDATCLLITNSEEEELDYEGVHVSVVPVWKWLLQKRKQDI
jgi:predicted AAA+ superfamily ATPase